MPSAPRPHRPRPTLATGGAPGHARPRPQPGPHAGPRPAPQPGLRPRPRPAAALVAPVVARPARTDHRWAASGIGRLRRPDTALARRASVGAIGAGLALFVVAAVATPLAGADPDAARATSGPTSADPSFAPSLDVPTVTVTGGPAVAAQPIVRKDAAATQAPVDHGAISKLAANGIPKVALNAYRVAAARMANADPGCGIDWSLIAGIGREESDHGRFGGAVLHADGTSTPAIVGPALTGAMWEYFGASPEYVPITGDTKYAHALGPMQFIPTTWAGYGADATGDGKADVFNINDAALGTARYLCAAGGDLTTQAGRVKAVLTYNHNDQYLAQVLALAAAYKAGVPISGIPVGITTGTLPKVKSGSVPPANPGAPTAADPTRPKPAAPRTTAPASPRPTTSSTPAGGTRSTPAPTPTRSTPRPSPTPTKSTSPTPTPSATPTCNPVEVVFGCKDG